MARSIKKGPLINPKLVKKVKMMEQLNKKEPIKTWARSSQIPPEFVGFTFLVHNGKTHLPVFINEAMVGHRLGEFSPTRTFHGHGKMTEKSKSKT